MLILFLFAFLSGLVTIFAPCIWPLLPVVLSSSSTGGKRRPLGITLGIASSFTFFTLSLSYILKIIPFDPEILRHVAVVILGFLGLTLIIPQLTQTIEGYGSRFASKFSRGTKQSGTGFISGYITGFSLGIVWSPCAGPILATIATLAATKAVNREVIFVTLAYVAGITIPLFILATFGSVLFAHSRKLSAYTGTIQRFFGVVMIVMAVAIATGYDRVVQTRLLQFFPSYTTFLTQLESNQQVKHELDTLRNGQPAATNANQLNIVFLDRNQDEVFDSSPLLGKPAPDFKGIVHWLNSNPLTMQQLRSKVVLVDFWTYTCINCIRTLPFVTSWYEKYKDKGFIVIGVHTPEFQFEHDTNNVLNAIKMFNIQYPVPQDNNYGTWNAYNNEYWPAEYLIDAKGNVRRTEFGEGNYDKMEEAIQTLLKEKGEKVGSSLVNAHDQTPHMSNISPETYLGSKRMQYLDPNGSVGNGQQTFTLIDNPPVNTFSYGGDWNITDETAIPGKNSVLTYHFSANKVYIILRPGKNPSNTATVKVLLDGKPIEPTVAGADVHNGIITIDTDRLYGIVDLKGNIGDHILKLEFQTPGVEAYTFTFG